MPTGLGDFIDEPRTEELHLMNIEYEEQFGNPIIHMWCREEDGTQRWVEVVDHAPSFYITEEAFSARVKNHEWVTGWEVEERASIHGEALVRVETKLPKHVGGGRDIGKPLREYFEKTWEADVFYANRFLIDTDIFTHFKVSQDDAWTGNSVKGDYRVSVDDIEPIEEPDWRAEPRKVTVDIEVESPNGFPDSERAEQPVTVVSAHDNYEDAYYVWLLRHESWVYSDAELRNMVIDARPDPMDLDDETVSVNVAEVNIYENESVMLDEFNQWVEDTRPDMLTGWNSSTADHGDAFDYPYLINRSKSLNNMSHRDWSPIGQVWQGNHAKNGNVVANAKGIEFFDLMQAYKKTQWQKPKGSYGLANISEKELPVGGAKLDLEDIDSAWETDPAEFVKYNLRDVQAVVGIDKAANVTSLFQNLRALTGAQFGDCHNNIDLLDIYILRFAKEHGIALPTNEAPERDWYYGAYNFEPKIGLHENVVYPDLWSMYPNMIRNVNMSPETIIGTEEDLRNSKYTEEDCRWTYIDTRPTNVKNPGGSGSPAAPPEPEKVYFLKPEHQRGFVTDVVDKLMGLKDDYDGTELYDAVKRIVNSVYGVFGDSDSYGKGYRLYDWRIAEGITLGGRRMIQDSSDKFIEEVNNVKRTFGFEGTNAYRVGGDTDSIMTAMPFIEADTQGDRERVVSIALKAAEYVNDWYDDWAHEQFNVPHGEHFCKLEIESYALRTFVPKGATKEKAKKKYAQLVIWEEGEWFDEPEFEVTGIDIVRSDRAIATREVAQEVIETILRTEDREEARDKVYDTISAAVEAVESGEKPLSYIARPRGMSKSPHAYGTSERRPMPTYRGAKYANQNFPWEHITAGAQPQLLYIENVRGDWPKYYDADTAEDGDEVDAVSLMEPDRLPDDFVVDVSKMLEKTLEDPLTPILEAMRWSFEDAVSDTQQVGIGDFM